ncbi:TPA: S8 family serine peptidase [Salmonella enterica]|nr:S8 family serine peptidase [Salmonella enterica]
MYNYILNSIGYKNQWHLHGRDVSGLTKMSSINVEKAWNILNGFGKNEVVIGFADDGCNLSSVDDNINKKFTAAAFLQDGKLMTGTASSIKNRMYIPPYRHGTALAGLIAAPLSSSLPVGVSPGCRLLPVRWEFDNGFHITQKGFYKILSFISNKVDIFINTWAKFPKMVFNDENLAMIRELTYKGGRRGKGIVFIWAAGNSGCPIHYSCDNDIIWSGCVGKDGLLYDVKKSKEFFHSLYNVDNVLIVSAINAFGKRAHYSCYGNGISICAPSNNKHCFESGLYIEKGLTTRSADQAGFTNNFKGTSGAAALVAGVAGLVISANMEASAFDVVSVIKSTALKSLDFVPYPTSKYLCSQFNLGLIEDSVIDVYSNGKFNLEGWSPWFGYGLVNAEHAVKLAINKKIRSSIYGG